MPDQDQLYVETPPQRVRVTISPDPIAARLGQLPTTAWGRDAGLSQTKISHLTCPVQDTDTRGGRIPLPCWAADEYEAKLVNADFEGRLGSPLWQQCQSRSTRVDEAAKDGSLCLGGACSPAPGYPWPPWGHENIPCAYSNSINQVTYYNSNDPRFVLGCGAAATMVLEARYD
jgi:hypothetical protein